MLNTLDVFVQFLVQTQKNITTPRTVSRTDNGLYTVIWYPSSIPLSHQSSLRSRCNRVKRTTTMSQILNLKERLSEIVICTYWTNCTVAPCKSLWLPLSKKNNYASIYFSWIDRWEVNVTDTKVKYLYTLPIKH